MSSVLIPFYHPEQVINCKPTKIVFNDNCVEIFCYHTIMQEREDNGIEEPILYDTQLTIAKNHIVYYEYGKHMQSDLYGFIIGFGKSAHCISFPDKGKCKEFYSQFQSWYNAHS